MGKNTKWKNYFWAGTLAAAILVCQLALWRLPERTVAWAEDTVPKRVALTFDDGPYQSPSDCCILYLGIQSLIKLGTR